MTLRPTETDLQTIWDTLQQRIIIGDSDTQNEANNVANYIPNTLNLLTKRVTMYLGDTYTTYIVTNATTITSSDTTAVITLSNSYTSANGDTVNTFRIDVTPIALGQKFITFASSGFVSVNLLVNTVDIT